MYIDDTSSELALIPEGINISITNSLASYQRNIQVINTYSSRTYCPGEQGGWRQHG